MPAGISTTAMDCYKIRAIMMPVIGDPEIDGGLIIQINDARHETTVAIVVQRQQKISYRDKNRGILQVSDVPQNLP